MTLAQGIDVSYAQGAIDWPKVANAVDFVFIRVTEGTSPDSLAVANLQGAQAAGVLHGGYHFAYPGLTNPNGAVEASVVKDAQAQATAFLSIMDLHGAKANLPPVLDLEVNTYKWTAKALGEWAIGWLSTVRAKAPRPELTPILYSDPAFIRPIVEAVPTLVEYRLWIANPTTSPSPTMPPAWPTWTVWQHSWTGHVDGISKPVDLDIWNGLTDSELKELFDLAKPPAGPKCIVWYGVHNAQNAQLLAQQYGWRATDITQPAGRAALATASQVVIIGGDAKFETEVKALAPHANIHKPLAGGDYWRTTEAVCQAAISGRF